jgi:hypothetical protein
MTQAGKSHGPEGRFTPATLRYTQFTQRDVINVFPELLF